MKIPGDKMKTIGRYSNVPLVLAVVLFVISALAIDANPERSNNAATYGYFLLAIGAVMKFIPYIGRKKAVENDTAV